MAKKSTPKRNPYWRAMVVILTFPVTVMAVAFAAWFSGDTLAFSTYQPNDGTDRPRVVMPERVKGAELTEYQCRQFKGAGDTAGTWYVHNCD